MNSDLEKVLTARLAETAQAAGRIDATRMAGTVVRRARRRRQHRSVTAVAAAAVLSAGVVSFIAVLDRDTPSAAPATDGQRTSAASPSPSTTEEPDVVSDRRLADWVNGLPLRRQAPVITGDASGLLRIERSSAATGAEDYEARVLLADRELIRGQVQGAALTPDGKRLALAVDHLNSSRDGIATTLIAAEVGTGRLLAEHPDVEPGMLVIGWAGDEVVLGVPEFRPDPGRLLTWMPGSSPRGLGTGEPIDVAEFGHRVLVSDRSCTRVLDLRTGDPITAGWCDDERLTAITDLGELAVTARLELVDLNGAASASLALALPGPMPEVDARISRDGQVVFTLEWRHRGWHEATIACPVNGDTCARVRDASPTPESVHVPPTAPAQCDPALLRPATRSGRLTSSPVADNEAAGPYGFYFAYVTTVQDGACTLPRYPVLLHVTGDRTVRLTPRRGTVLSRGGAPAVIDPESFAVATLQIATERQVCRSRLRTPRAYDELRFDIGNGDTIMLGTDLRTPCPLRLGPWDVNP